MKHAKGYFTVGDLVTFASGDRWYPPNSNEIGIIIRIFDHEVGDLVTVWWGGPRQQNVFAQTLQKL